MLVLAKLHPDYNSICYHYPQLSNKITITYVIMTTGILSEFSCEEYEQREQWKTLTSTVCDQDEANKNTLWLVIWKIYSAYSILLRE